MIHFNVLNRCNKNETNKKNNTLKSESEEV